MSMEDEGEPTAAASKKKKTAKKKPKSPSGDFRPDCIVF
jgi:hypothetical protein